MGCYGKRPGEEEHLQFQNFDEKKVKISPSFKNYHRIWRDLPPINESLRTGLKPLHKH
jgi:hypothetical protein